MKFVYPEGATPFNYDDIHNLIPQHITTQSQLNEWEQRNILKAEKWLFSFRKKNILTIDFLKKLHLKMFNETWTWAGKYREYQTNVGCVFFEIPAHLKILCDDVSFWLENNTFTEKEMAVRFHHRLVQIHPFPNGNGRYGRLATDAFLVSLKLKHFTWGRINLVEPSQTRGRYIKALREADQGNYEDLLSFVES